VEDANKRLVLFGCIPVTSTPSRSWIWYSLASIRTTTISPGEGHRIIGIDCTPMSTASAIPCGPIRCPTGSTVPLRYRGCLRGVRGDQLGMTWCCPRALLLRISRLRHRPIQTSFQRAEQGLQARGGTAGLRGDHGDGIRERYLEGTGRSLSELWELFHGSAPPAIATMSMTSSIWIRSRASVRGCGTPASGRSMPWWRRRELSGAPIRSGEVPVLPQTARIRGRVRTAQLRGLR